MAILGIDLGTYNSSAATVREDGKIEMVEPAGGAADIQGSNVFPSFVKLKQDGSIAYVGIDAKNDLQNNPALVVWGVKRLIGKAYDDVIKDLGRFAYPAVKGADGRVVIHVGDKSFSPSDISALVMKKIKADAEGDWNALGKITATVVSVPAYFHEEQVRATKEAAELAELPNLTIIREPVASAIAYGIEKIKEKEIAFVFDLGAGTLDTVLVALVRDSKGLSLGEAYPPAGDSQLGGLDMDDLIVDYIIGREHLDTLSEAKKTIDSCRRGGKKLPFDKEFMRTMRELFRLRSDLENAKIRLSTEMSAHVSFFYHGVSKNLTITREDLNQVVSPVVDRCRVCIRNYFNQIGINPSDISRLLLIGGPVKMPAIRNMLAEEFKGNKQVRAQLREISEKGFPIDPMQCVAYGAAKSGTMKDVYQNTSPFDYGIALDKKDSLSGMVKRGQILPYQKVRDIEITGIVPGLGRNVELSLTKDSAYKIGDYSFRASFDEAMCSHIAFTMNATSEGIIDISVKDCITGSVLELPMLSILSEKKFEQVLVEIPDGTGVPNPNVPVPPSPAIIREIMERFQIEMKGRPDDPVDPNDVKKVVHIARAKVCEAKNLMAGKANHRVLADGAIKKIEQWIGQVPDNSTTTFRVYEEIVNAIEGLDHIINILGGR